MSDKSIPDIIDGHEFLGLSFGDLDPLVAFLESERSDIPFLLRHEILGALRPDGDSDFKLVLVKRKAGRGGLPERQAKALRHLTVGYAMLRAGAGDEGCFEAAITKVTEEMKCSRTTAAKAWTIFRDVDLPVPEGSLKEEANEKFSGKLRSLINDIVGLDLESI